MNLSNIITKYLVRFPSEYDRLSELAKLLEKTPDNEILVSRKSFEGHITSSAILISRKTNRMLKLKHPVLERFLQPGGHITNEMCDPLKNSKELLKKLGILNKVSFVPDTEHELFPLDIDSHKIPENREKLEPEHYHHDFRYLFACDDEFDLGGETVQWEDIPTLKEEKTFEDLIEKVQFLWSKEYDEKQFYNSITNKVNLSKDVGFLVVQHFLDGVEHFLRSLDSIGKVEAVIPKPKSKIGAISKRVEKFFPVLEIESRDDLIDSSKIKEILNNTERPLVLIDIGGWFAPHIIEWSNNFPREILGVVEDTENGHQKYQEVKNYPFPVISVARSPLKLNEDTLIGLSIVFSSDKILRSRNKLLKYMTCGVIGYGKVGKSIASDLLKNSIKPIVYDINPLKMIEAYNDGCIVMNKEVLLSTCDSIYCATGNQSIQTKELGSIKVDAYLFSVTSADDEFKFDGIEKLYRSEKVSEYVKRIYKFDKSFHLVHEGEAVNFIDNAVVGEFIHLVKAEMLVAIKTLVNSTTKSNKISVVNGSERKEIAETWLKNFQNIE